MRFARGKMRRARLAAASSAGPLMSIFITEEAFSLSEKERGKHRGADWSLSSGTTWKSPRSLGPPGPHLSQIHVLCPSDGPSKLHLSDDVIPHPVLPLHTPASCLGIAFWHRVVSAFLYHLPNLAASFSKPRAVPSPWSLAGPELFFDKRI